MMEDFLVIFFNANTRVFSGVLTRDTPPGFQPNHIQMGKLVLYVGVGYWKAINSPGLVGVTFWLTYGSG